MAKRGRRRVVRFRFMAGLVILLVLGFLYGYWAPFPYQPTVVGVARQERVSPFLVAAVIRVESRFRPDAVSARGAVGLMQLMPSSAGWIFMKMGRTGTPDLTDPATSIHLGSWYLRYLLNSYGGNATLALAAYNGGPETVNRWLASGVLSAHQRSYQAIPYPETANFVRRVREFETVYGLMYFWVGDGTHSASGGGLNG